MTPDRTQFQDDEQQRQSRELSERRSRPPIDVSGYESRQFLGAGAYGEVWVAVDQNTGRRVAIKFYTQKSGVDWSLLSREVEKLVFLSADRYVVQLLDVGWDSEPPYYVMEYVDGGSLQQLLEKEGTLPIGEAVEMFREIVTGLLHAHGKGVLHCDLKPDNILLDQDRKPRLADFGQSRLSHEQAPALGTLFYMAPEQADLDAVPDARWDVYALGAILFSMVTGSAPHRSEKLLTLIDSESSLAGRLDAYREGMRALGPPIEHRQLRGMDRELADIVDRCLVEDPERRFPNVQSVLTAIRSRDQSRDRRPLLLLGLLGPLLFLVVLGVFGSSAYRNASTKSRKAVEQWVRESSQFAAELYAEKVERKFDRYFDDVAEVAKERDLQETIRQLTTEFGGDLKKSLAEGDEAKFLMHPLRQKLQQRTQALIDEDGSQVASWFITDAKGIQLAASFSEEDDARTSTLGRDFSWRSYFHGGNKDYKPGTDISKAPLKSTKLSVVFQSEATKTFKVAVSSPIKRDGETIGVVALTVELGRLGDGSELAATGKRFVTIVDSNGRILQHPLFDRILARETKLPDFSDESFNVDLNAINTELYEDRLGKAGPEDGVRPEDAEVFAIKFIAARRQVQLQAEEGEAAADAKPNSDLYVLVQENFDAANKPISELEAQFRRDAIYAVLIILIGVVYLWYLVQRAIRNPQDAMRRGGGASAHRSSLQTMETVEMPARLRQRDGDSR